jgi:hypothetical protein
MIGGRMLAAVLVAGGCVTAATVNVHVLDDTALRASQPRTIVVVKSAPPDFAARASQHPETISDLAAGDTLVGKNGVEDPSWNVGSAIGGVLAQRYALRQVSGDDIAPRATRPTQIAMASRRADIVVDVRTLSWGYGPLDRSRYDVTYEARLRLIDARSGAVIAEGACVAPAQRAWEAPTLDELTANGADGLKEKLRAATRFCVSDLETRIIGVTDVHAPMRSPG